MALLVADSGPLIALARLDLLRLPAQLVREVQVPASVWTEVKRAPRGNDLSRLEAALEAGWLAVAHGPQVLDVRLEDAPWMTANWAHSAWRCSKLQQS